MAANAHGDRAKPVIATCAYCDWRQSTSGVDRIAAAHRLRALVIEHVETQHPEKFGTSEFQKGQGH